MQTQTLVERIESILKLVDAQDSGFVTWESFARVLLAVAPPKLLRDDVVQFMQSQTDSDQNLVDYREFIISGKVMIVDRHRKGYFILFSTIRLHSFYVAHKNQEISRDCT